MDDDPRDRLAIRELIESWAVWRDAGDWERFRRCWHDDGVMIATWFRGSAEDFIRVTREGWARGIAAAARNRRAARAVVQRTMRAAGLTTAPAPLRRRGVRCSSMV